MKKNKNQKNELKNAADAFFANEDSSENNLESFRNEANLWQEENSSDLHHKAILWRQS